MSTPIPPRAEVCARELTRDPVFLFERRELARDDDGELCEPSVWYWHAERVFGTREEGEAFGNGPRRA